MGKTERGGFEPPNEVNPRYAISSRARSAAPAPLLTAAGRLAGRQRAIRRARRADQICHSCARITGTVSPPGRSPSIDTSAEPIMKSVWISETFTRGRSASSVTPIW